MPFASIDQILDDLRGGRMIVLIDDQSRENEGDLVCAAEHIDAEVVNFMTRHARGVLCVALDPEACDRLELTPQSPINTAQLATAFTVSVDAVARFGVSTGVSASDRATTIRLLADITTRPADLARPGHINPLRARTGGVLVRTGQTEGSVDLCRLAGLQAAAAIIEIMNDDGSMARLDDLQQLCERHSLNMCSVADIVAHRLRGEKLIERMAEAPFESAHGCFRLIAYRSAVDALPHVALCKGRVGQEPVNDPVLVRVHAQNLLGDVLADANQPTSAALHESLRRVEEAGEGAVIYMRQEGLGTGLLRQLQTIQSSTSEENRDLSTALRQPETEAATNIGIGSQILADLGLRRLRLMTSRPHSYPALEGFGLEVVEYVKI